MNASMSRILAWCFLPLCTAAIAAPSNLDLVRQFSYMYQHKHFTRNIFDIKHGYLQTQVSNNNDKMPLNYFIHYSNLWWFNVVQSVDVPAVGYDKKTQTGFIILDIHYGDGHLLRGMQYIKFKHHKISYIRTYSSPTFWDSSYPAIQLDKYGNQIWLTTGYSLPYSIKAARLFLSSPKAKELASNQRVKMDIKKIKHDMSLQ